MVYFVFLQSEIFVNMKEYNTEETPSPMVNEPVATYAKLTPDHKAMPYTSPKEKVSQSGRMSVDEFCNILHEYVDEYYDSIQS